ncbi:MAG: hypothetical protein V4485_04140 [Pseudomonadota bacterium]
MSKQFASTSTRLAMATDVFSATRSSILTGARKMSSMQRSAKESTSQFIGAAKNPILKRLYNASVKTAEQMKTDVKGVRDLYTSKIQIASKLAVAQGFYTGFTSADATIDKPEYASMQQEEVARDQLWENTFGASLHSIHKNFDSLLHGAEEVFQKANSKTSGRAEGSIQRAQPALAGALGMLSASSNTEHRGMAEAITHVLTAALPNAIAHTAYDAALMAGKVTRHTPQLAQSIVESLKKHQEANPGFVPILHESSRSMGRGG